MEDEKFMRLALAQAEETLAENGYPVGAVVVSKGEVIGAGRKLMGDFHMGHAEMNALHEATSDRRLTRADELVVYTTLEPCVMCYGTILNCPVAKVVYAMEDVYGGATKMEAEFMPRHHGKSPEIVSGVLREESRALLRRFLETTDDPFWINPDNRLVQAVMT